MDFNTVVKVYLKAIKASRKAKRTCSQRAIFIRLQQETNNNSQAPSACLTALSSSRKSFVLGKAPTLSRYPGTGLSQSSLFGYFIR